MPEIQKLNLLQIKPGISRDGTLLDCESCSDGQWVRFQRGRPKKMGGYSRITDQIIGPIRELLVWSRGYQISLFSFSPSKIEQIVLDQGGAGTYVIDVTPVSGFTSDTNLLWSVDTMYDSAAGSLNTLVLALPTKVGVNIDDTTEYPLFTTVANSVTAFATTGDSNAVASGGVFVSAPYAILYGSDGKVTWSNANEPKNYTTGDAGTARITGSKIVNGKPISSGSGAAGLLWALDSVMRMDYIGGDAIFRFSRVGASSILAESSVIEYDGMFYWIGIDRFFLTDGSNVRELPNATNLNWFFDNLNFDNRQKVWAMKIPRFGEIWWFYPRGTATECTHAIIYNIRENCWYDCELNRSAGYYSQVFHYPIMASSTVNNNRSITYTVVSGSFSKGDRILGTITGAVGIITYDTGTEYHISLVGTTEFTTSDYITNLTGTGSGTVNSYHSFYSIYSHEKGLNRVEDQEIAIPSSFTTYNFGFPISQGINNLTRLVRIEPDFLQSGTMNVEVVGYDYASSNPTTDGPFSFTDFTEKIDMRVQRRHIKLKFTSNEFNGHYEVGKLLVWTEPGDIRP